MNSIQAVMSLVLMGSGGAPMNSNDSASPALTPEIHNTPEAVVLKATSRGCTQKKDFQLKVGRDHSLYAKRLRRDRCKKAPKVIELKYSYEELGLTPSLIQGNRIVRK